MLAAWADYEMLSLCLGQSENSAAFGAFSIDVGLSVLEFVFSQSEKATEFFVFFASLGYIS